MALLGLTVWFFVSLFLVGSIEIEAKACTVYVVPDNSAENCTGINHTNCSLMYYAAHPEFFTEDNTIFLFLTGYHLLVNSTHLYMANISNLTLRGENGYVSETRVMCNGQNPGSFSFYNITNLTIENLSFIRCSGSAEHFRGLTAVEMHLIHNMDMSNIYINGTAGYGLSLCDLYGSSVLFNITVESSYNASGGNFAFYCSDYYTSQEDAMLTHSLNVTNSYFINGVNNDISPRTGSGIYISVNCRTKINIIFDTVVLTGNRGYVGGNMGIDYFGTSFQWTVAIFILNSELSWGTASVGGGISIIATVGTNSSNNMDGTYSQNSANILTIVNTLFEHNTVSGLGGGIYFQLTNPSAAVGGIVGHNCIFRYNKISSPLNSTYSYGGVGVHVFVYTLPEFIQHKTGFFVLSFSKCIFLRNVIHSTAHYNVSRTGALFAMNAQAIHIKGCRFIENNCTGIAAIKSHILFHGENVIRRNSAYKGGGMFFSSGGLMYLYNGTRLIISENNAYLSGGGIYVAAEDSPWVPHCFYQVENLSASNFRLHKTQVYLINNTAPVGTALYGGLIDECNLFGVYNQPFDLPGKIFDVIFVIHNKSHDLTAVSSDPMYIGFCEINSTTKKLSTSNCPQTTSKTVIPESIFHVPAVIMGQRYGLVTGTVSAHCVNKNCSVPHIYYSQSIQKKAILTYSVTPGSERKIEIQLDAEDYFSTYPTYRYQPSYIYVTIMKCPLGFREEHHRCLCDFLKAVTCNITRQSLTRLHAGWIGFKEEHPHNTSDIISQPHCPLGYCLNNPVVINTTHEYFDQDAQCAYHRTGLLCGRCKANYSLGFGSLQCLSQCSSELQFLRVIGLIVVCAVAGILLVVLLTLLNLTVAEGTLNGLIFYANVIQVNSNIFFPPETHARLWTAFIAWLNLDFGVTVCFYEGMDAYAKTWLQFIFPLYIWLISGGIVYFSRKYRRVAQYMGKNAVKVLATLFLLSFGKLIRTVIGAVTFTNVKSIINISVWLQDATVHYLHGYHIVLWIAGAITGLLALLYALTLTFIQCLRRTPNNGMFVWVRRLKPLLDAYTGPYKDRYHFWTGFLLLVRLSLFNSFAVNFQNDPTLNFILIIIVSSLLIMVIQLGIYRYQLIGFLESSMYTNLVLFSAVMALSDSHTVYATIAVHFFSGWAFLTFTGIVFYHWHKQFIDSQNCFQKKLWVREHGERVIQPLVIGRGDSDNSEESEDEHEMIMPS